MSTATVMLCDLCGKPDATSWKINKRTVDLCPDCGLPIHTAHQAGRTTRPNPRSKATPRGIQLQEPYPDPPQRRGGLKVEAPQADPPAKR